MLDPLKYCVEAFLVIWNALPFAFNAFFLFIVILGVLSFLIDVLR